MTPTAKEFLKIYLKNNPEGTYDLCMIEFAKLHAKEALKVAYYNHELDDVKYSGCSECFRNDKELNKDSILNAYPLNNIK